MKTPWHSGALHEAVKLMPKRADAVSGVCRPCFGRNWAIILTFAYCWGDSPSLGWPRHECGGQQSWLPFPSLNNFLSGLSPAIIGIKMSLREFFAINWTSPVPHTKWPDVIHPVHPLWHPQQPWPTDEASCELFPHPRASYHCADSWCCLGFLFCAVWTLDAQAETRGSYKQAAQWAAQWPAEVGWVDPHLVLSHHVVQSPVGQFPPISSLPSACYTSSSSYLFNLGRL